MDFTSTVYEIGIAPTLTPLPWTGTPADNRYTYAAANPLTNSDPTGFVLDGTSGASASTVAAYQAKLKADEAALNAPDSRHD